METDNESVVAGASFFKKKKIFFLFVQNAEGKCRMEIPQKFVHESRAKKERNLPELLLEELERSLKPIQQRVIAQMNKNVTID